VIGSPSEREYDILAKKVPFDPKLFKEFPTMPKNTEENSKFNRMFLHIKDKKNLLDLVGKIFTYIPEERLTAKEALAHPFFDTIRQQYASLQLH
jgi:serine/threonine protein kinase